MMLKPYLSAGLLAVLLFCAHIANRQTTTATSGTLVLAQGLSMTVPACFVSGNARSAKQNVAFACSLGAVNGSGGGYVFSKVSGSFPAGISDVNATGFVSGTPTGTSAGTEIVKLIDSSGTSIQSAITITPSSLSSIAVTPAGASVQATQSIPFTAVGSWSDSSTLDISSLAAWSCTTTCGSFSGATFTAGSSSGTATIKATFNSVTDDGGLGVSLTVSTSTPTIQNSSPLCAGAINQPYPDNANPAACTPGAGQNFSATGGTPPYTWAVVSGCPSGLTMSGVASSLPVPLVGTPTASGTFGSCQIKVTDNASNSVTGTFSITIAIVSTVSVSPSSPTVTANTTIQMQATANYSDSSTANVTAGTGISRLGSASAGTASATSSTSLAFPAINLPAGVLLVVQAGCSGTGTISVADTAGNTFTAVDSPTNGPSGATYFDSGLFYVTNTTANAADVVTITYGTSCAFQNANLAWYSGIATSSPLDQHALGETNASGTLGSSCGSAAFTTTTANQLLFSSCTNGSTSRTFTAGNNYNLVVAQPGGQSAIEDQIVSAIQTSVKSAFTFSGATDNHIGLTATFKAAAGAGATWSITAGSCTVNGNGVVTANSGTSCTAQASYGGQTGSQVITISTPALQSIAVTPNPASGTVGGSVQFTATGTFAGGSTQNITSTAQWLSSNTAVATINASGVASLLAGGTAEISASVGATNSPKVALTVSSSGTASLLAGCVVTGTNPTSTASVSGCKGTFPPAGWSLVTADGAESSLPASEVLDSFGTHVCAIGSNNSLGFPFAAHTGTHSYCNLISGNGSLTNVYTRLPSNYHQVLISGWVYADPSALYGNSDYTYFQFNGTQNGGVSCNVNVQAQQSTLNPASSTNSEYFPLHAYKGSSSCQEYFWYGGPYWLPAPQINAGVWMQVEALYIPNTTFTATTLGATPPSSCSSPSQAGCGNGTLKVWQNGILVLDAENADLNGGDLTNMTVGASASIGGLISSFSTTGTTCNVFSSSGGGTCPGTQPGTGGPKPYYRYEDDIIVMTQ